MIAGRARRTSGAACAGGRVPASPCARPRRASRKLDHAHAETLAALSDEEMRLSSLAGQSWDVDCSPCRNRFPGLAADRHDAQLCCACRGRALRRPAGLRGTTDRAPRVRPGAGRRSRRARTSPGRESPAGLLVSPFRAGDWPRRAKASLGSALGLFGGRTLSTGLCVADSLLPEPAVEAAPGGERPPERAAAEAMGVQLGDEAPDVMTSGWRRRRRSERVSDGRCPIQAVRTIRRQSEMQVAPVVV
jgi:hypothetical protein